MSVAMRNYICIKCVVDELTILIRSIWGWKKVYQNIKKIRIA